MKTRGTGNESVHSLIRFLEYAAESDAVFHWNEQSYAWRRSGTQCTWRRRWMDWCSNWWTSEHWWSCRRKCLTQSWRPRSWERRRSRYMTSKSRIHSRPSGLSQWRCAELWLLMTPKDYQRVKRCLHYHVRWMFTLSHVYVVHRHTLYMHDVHVRRRCATFSTCLKHRTCTTYMCDECLHYHKCTSYMYDVHVRRTCAIV